MSAFFISLLMSLGVSAWIYNQFMNRTGGNTKSALTSAAIVGGVAFVFLMILFSFIL